MKATNIKWDILPENPDELLKLPKEANIPAEIFFDSVILTHGPAESVCDGTYEEIIGNYLTHRFNTKIESFDIEMGECTEIKDSFNRVMDDESDTYGIINRIQYLLDMGVETSTLINDLHYEVEDVKAAMEEDLQEEQQF